MLVGGTTVTPTTKTLSSATSITNGKQYTLTLSGVSNTGSLSLVIAANTLTDGAGNKNTQTSISTGITMEKPMAYIYNETRGTNNYCVTGDESTCQATNCYKNKTAGSCPVGTIIDYKVNNTETVRFHVIEDKGSTMTMQSQKNTVTKEMWYTEYDNTKGPLTVLPTLESATSGWTNVNNQTYTMGTTVFKNNAYTGCRFIDESQSYSCSKNIYKLSSRTAKSRMITIQEALAVGCTGNDRECPKWMYNYLKSSTVFDGTIDEGEDSGYWTMNAPYSEEEYFQTYAFTIFTRGGFMNSFPNYDTNAARAVVVISK